MATGLIGKGEGGKMLSVYFGGTAMCCFVE